MQRSIAAWLATAIRAGSAPAALVKKQINNVRRKR
jgi:hypothetical protein